jgi:hypothetical protein
MLCGAAIMRFRDAWSAGCVDRAGHRDTEHVWAADIRRHRYSVRRAAAPLNGLSAPQVIDDARKAGLPAKNPQEITSVKCARVPFLEAISTETVSVFKFRATGLAQRFIGSRSEICPLA